MSKTFPYAERFAVNRTLPAHGRQRADVLAELRTMANEEDAFWETGKVSGSMYCGDFEHYAYLDEAFSMYAHMNALQRDMCPSATRFEGEIIAMAFDLFHGPTDGTTFAATSPDTAPDNRPDTTPGGLVTTGGTGSIIHAVLAYREHAAQTRGISQPNFVKPETAHPAFDKACHLFSIELRQAKVDPATTKADVAEVERLIDDQTIAIVGSACNYGYGTIDPIEELGELAQSKGVGLHVDGCLGGFILPFGEELGYDIPRFDFRVPGVTSISADTHKYGYSLKGTSWVGFRDKAVRNAQYFFLPGWTGGKYMSPGIEGSRSSGLLAAAWASMVHLGRDGYRRYAEQIFATADVMKAAVRSYPELRIIGDPTFLFSFTSDVFDIYLVNDFMRTRGWRFNGQQYPDALHMAVTRPQTQPGVVDAFVTDLADGVAYAKEKHAAGEKPFTGAVYGSVAGGLTDEAEAFIKGFMSEMLDDMQSVP